MAKNKSVAANQFPLIVWREGQKYLWNPIHRKALKNLPEERVRLRVLEYLMHGGWSKHRISTEEAIDLPQKETSLRTDLICYTREFSPLLLVECKAENITLSEKTATQIARYNQGVSAPFLLMTNGCMDHWYALSENRTARLEYIPDTFPSQNKPETDFNYWQLRGFVGNEAPAKLRLWLNQRLPDAFCDTSIPTRHLSFRNSPGDIDLNNYYTIHTKNEHRLALSFTATEFGSSRLIGILNREGKNEAVLEVNLEFLFNDRAPNASIYWTGDTQIIDIRDSIASITDPKTDLHVIVSGISKMLINLIQ